MKPIFCNSKYLHFNFTRIKRDQCDRCNTVALIRTSQVDQPNSPSIYIKYENSLENTWKFSILIEHISHSKHIVVLCTYLFATQREIRMQHPLSCCNHNLFSVWEPDDTIQKTSMAARGGEEGEIRLINHGIFRFPFISGSLTHDGSIRDRCWPYAINIPININLG